MMRVFMAILCSLLAVCSVSARNRRHEGTDGQAAIYRLPLFERAVRCTKYFEGWHSEKHHPYVGYGHRFSRGEKVFGTHHDEAAGGRASAKKTCGSSARCSSSSGRIRCYYPKFRITRVIQTKILSQLDFLLY